MATPEIYPEDTDKNTSFLKIHKMRKSNKLKHTKCGSV